MQLGLTLSKNAYLWEEFLERATAAMKEHFSGSDILPTLEEFFRA